MIYGIAGLVTIVFGLLFLYSIIQDHSKYGGIYMRARENQVRTGAYLYTFYALGIVVLLAGIGSMNSYFMQ